MSKNKIKILNLYSCIGGNRAFWPSDKIEVTAVELDPEVARFYADRFPMDDVVVGDAETYCENHFEDFDFIWASPPCQDDGQFKYNVGYKNGKYRGRLPSLGMYRYKIFLDSYGFDGKYLIENTRPYYVPLMPFQKIGRHYMWANYDLHQPDQKIKKSQMRSRNKISSWEEFLGISLDGYKILNKRQHMRNAVDSTLGLHVLRCAFPEL